MLICLLLFTSLVFAEDFSSERYCFSTPREALTAEQKFNAIKVPSDSVTRDESCLVIQMYPHRRELIQRYILSVYPSAQIAFSSQEIKRDPCKLKVEKERNEEANEKQILLGEGPTLSAQTKKNQGKETFFIQTQKEFELTVDQDQIKGECRSITPTRYEISLEIKKNPKPIYPESLPQNSVIVLNAPPPDQKTSALKTTLQLNQGERVELSSIIKKLKNDFHVVDAKPEGQIEAAPQISAEKIFLSFE